MKIVFREIGTIGINSLVKFPRQKTLWQVIAHENGYTRLLEFSDFVTNMPFGPATLTVVDRIKAQLVEGF